MVRKLLHHEVGSGPGATLSAPAPPAGAGTRTSGASSSPTDVPAPRTRKLTQRFPQMQLHPLPLMTFFPPRQSLQPTGNRSPRPTPPSSARWDALRSMWYFKTYLANRYVWARTRQPFLPPYAAPTQAPLGAALSEPSPTSLPWSGQHADNQSTDVPTVFVHPSIISEPLRRTDPWGLIGCGASHAASL